MRAVAEDEFLRFKFLSGITWSPEGKSAVLAVTKADRKKDGYETCLWLYRSGAFSPLTSAGREKTFRYLDEDTVLFISDREEKEEPEETVIYRISLSGGEARKYLTLPLSVRSFEVLEDGSLLVTGLTHPGFEEAYRDARVRAAMKEAAEKEKDYEVIEQVPWWHNGGTFTRGAYPSLFYLNAKKAALTRISEAGEAVSDAVLSPDKKTVYYFAQPVRPLMSLADGKTLYAQPACGGERRTLAEDGEKFVMRGVLAGEKELILLAHDDRFGVNTDVDFYGIDPASGERRLRARWGESIGSSVGSDIRYGGGKSAVLDGEDLYFISTIFDSAGIYKLSGESVEPVLVKDGSVDCLDVKGGKILAVALHDMKGQEVIDGKGRKISAFNACVLRGAYVARPETLNVQRDGYEVHGFVLPPKDFDPEKKYPVILDVHGGPKTVYGPVFYHEMQYWAGKGYFVIFCNPTGSDGRGAFMDIRGKYGTVDYEDIMAFTDAALAACPAMDKERLFETGGSYGGFMTNWIIGHTDRFRACASQRSISDWFSFYGVSDIGVRFAEDQCAADPWTDPAKMWEASPMKYADRVKTPTLFIHSFEDYRCPVDQGYQMFTALVAHGVEARMVAFRGENHELSRSGRPSHRLRRLAEITAWFDKRL